MAVSYPFVKSYVMTKLKLLIQCYLENYLLSAIIIGVGIMRFIKLSYISKVYYQKQENLILLILKIIQFQPRQVLCGGGEECLLSNCEPYMTDKGVFL